jgi:enamine deaminase RidA (YjgF/YER057c/UK114 family)
MRTFIAIVAALLIAGSANAQTAKKEYIGPVPADASSTAVKVPANQHLLFLAGHTASKPEGSSDYGTFDVQVKAAFAKIDKTLKASGAKLTDIVQLSVFLTDMRYQPQFAKLVQDMFKGGYPAIAYIEVSHMADPQLLIEIQPIAVIP